MDGNTEVSSLLQSHGGKRWDSASNARVVDSPSGGYTLKGIYAAVMEFAGGGCCECSGVFSANQIVLDKGDCSSSPFYDSDTAIWHYHRREKRFSLYDWLVYSCASAPVAALITPSLMCLYVDHDGTSRRALRSIFQGQDIGVSWRSAPNLALINLRRKIEREGWGGDYHGFLLEKSNTTLYSIEFNESFNYCVK